MLFSLIIAFTVTPWAATRVLKLHGHGATRLNESGQEVEPQDWFTRFYHWVMDPLIAHAVARWAFLSAIVVLLIGAMGLVGFGLVKVKMLPFDNKSSFQVILNMPEGTALETTQAVTAEMARAVRAEPEVSHTQVYAGTAAPFNFNGLVRQYYNRQGPTVADVQVNLLPRHARQAQSHDVALRVRPNLAAIAEKHGGVVAVAEVPPGPPVLQTLVAEVYGPSRGDRMALAERIRAAFEAHPDVVDVDWFVEAPQPKLRFLIDEEKAALSGISEQTVADTLATALTGRSVDLLHQPREREDVDILVEVPRDRRSRPADLLKLRIRAPGQPEAPLIPLSELVRIEKTTTERNWLTSSSCGCGRAARWAKRWSRPEPSASARCC
ncbi:MAG: efflux RND transporter permease subunit [Opitutales bacterium]